MDEIKIKEVNFKISRLKHWLDDIYIIKKAAKNLRQESKAIEIENWILSKLKSFAPIPLRTEI